MCIHYNEPITVNFRWRFNETVYTNKMAMKAQLNFCRITFDYNFVYAPHKFMHGFDGRIFIL